MTDVFWMRCGDQDDYNAYNTLTDVAERLIDEGVASVEYHCEYGIRSSWFDDYDYISLYLGPPTDAGAPPTRELNASELKKLNWLLQM